VLLTVAVLLMPHLMRITLGLDGVTYADLSRNLAEGRGTIWKPHYTPALYPDFYEHPPLYFWAEGLFFYLLGDHLWVERIVSLLWAVLAAWGLVVLWRQVGDAAIAEDDERGAFGLTRWAVVLSFFALPVAAWCYGNNMLETLLTVFCIWVAVATLQAVQTGRWVWAAVAGILVVAAVLTKGPLGLFPLGIPVAYALCGLGQWRRSVVATVVMALTVVAVSALLALSAEARQNIEGYLNAQIIPSLTGKRTNTNELGKLTLLVGLGKEFLYMSIAWVVQLLVRLRPQWRWPLALPVPTQRLRLMVFFMVCGIGGSLPQMVSPKQSTYYLVPALAFYAAAWALALWPTWSGLLWALTRPLGKRLVQGVAAVLLAGLVATPIWYYTSGRAQRDIPWQWNMATFWAQQVPTGSVIGSSENYIEDWLMYAVFERVGLSLQPHPERLNEKPPRYYFAPQGHPLPPWAQGRCQPIACPIPDVAAYRCPQ